MRRLILLAATLSFLAIAGPDRAAAQQVVIQPTPVVSPGGRVIVQPGVSPRERAQLRAQLAARRALNLQRFQQYAARGAFPDNHVRPGMLNVMIDDEGKICAAANLMALDGLMGLVQQTAQRDNYLRFVNVHQGPLMAWMLSSGLTQEEIDQIQEPYDFIGFDDPRPIPVQEDDEKLRLQARFREVAATLRRNRERSLDVALERLLVWRGQHGVPLNAVVQPTGDPSVVVALRPPTQPVVVQPVVQPIRVHPLVQPNVRVRVRVASANPGSPLVWAPGMPVPGRR